MVMSPEGMGQHLNIKVADPIPGSHDFPFGLVLVIGGSLHNICLLIIRATNNPALCPKGNHHLSVSAAVPYGWETNKIKVCLPTSRLTVNK